MKMFLHTMLHPMMIVLPMIAGWFVPQAAVFSGTIRWVIVFMLFLACLRLRISDMKPERCHWLVLGMNLLMGIVPYVLISVLCPGQRELAQAAFFVGITPTATAAPVVMSFLNGRVGTVVTGFALTNIGIPLSLPLLLPWVTGEHSFRFVWDVIKNLLFLVVLPVGASCLVRRIHPDAVEWPKRCKMFSFSLWSFVLFVIAAIARRNFLDNPQQSPTVLLEIFGVSLVLCVMNFSIGHFLGPRSRSRECSQMLGQKNTTFTIYLALTFAGPVAAFGPILYVIWHNLWNAFQIFFYDRRNGKKEQQLCILKTRNGESV